MNRTVSLPAGSESFHGLRLVRNLAAHSTVAFPDAFDPADWPRVHRPVGHVFPRRPMAVARVGSLSWRGAWLWLALLGLSLLGALWQFTVLPDASDRLDAFPASGYGFDSREIMADDTDRAVFGDARLLKREYRVGQQDMLVRVVDPSPTRNSVIDPLFFFEGTGWLIAENTDIPLPGGQARHLKLRRNGQTTEAILWYSDLRSRHASSTREWWQSVSRRLSFGYTGPAPVLVILQAASPTRSIDWADVFDRLPMLFEL